MLKAHYSRTIWIVIVITVVGIGAFLATKNKSDLSNSPAACVNKNVGQNASGHCVSDLQNLLNVGLYGIDSPIYTKITGQFSVKTVSQVKQFQDNNSLSQTGIVDMATWEKLCANGSDASDAWTKAAEDAGCKV